MKSFADWTDEIRLLMNPPKPLIDPGVVEDELTDYDPSLLREVVLVRNPTSWHGDARLAAFVEAMRNEKLSQWQVDLLNNSAEDLKRASMTFSRARQCGKSKIANFAQQYAKHAPAVKHAFEIAAQHGQAWVGYDQAAGDDHTAVVVRTYDGQVVHREILC